MSHNSLVGELGGISGIYGVEVISDGTRLLSWSADNTARLWDLDSGQVLAVMQHQSDVVGASYLENQQSIVTWSADGSVKKWNYPWLAVDGNIFSIACERWRLEHHGSRKSSERKICTSPPMPVIWEAVMPHTR